MIAQAILGERGRPGKAPWRALRSTARSSSHQLRPRFTAGRRPAVICWRIAARLIPRRSAASLTLSNIESGMDRILSLAQAFCPGLNEKGRRPASGERDGGDPPQSLTCVRLADLADPAAASKEHQGHAITARERQLGAGSARRMRVLPSAQTRTMARSPSIARLIAVPAPGPWASMKAARSGEG